MFKIGDIVEVVPHAPYGFTRAGSWGTVWKRYGTEVYVDWTYISGTGPFGKDETLHWAIFMGHLRLREEASLEKRVINKINKLYSKNRFAQERGWHAAGNSPT